MSLRVVRTGERPLPRPAIGAAWSPARVVSNTASQVVTFCLSWGVRAIIAIVVARRLGPAGLGVFTVAWTIGSILSMLAPAGLPALLVRELARRPEHARAGDALTLSIILGGVLGACVAIVPAAAGASGAVRGAFAATGALVALAAPARVVRSHLHARERMHLETLVVAIEGLVAVGVALHALSGGASVAGAMAGLAAGQAAGLVASFAVAARIAPGAIRPACGWRTWAAMLAAAAPMAMAYAFTTLTLRVDVILLSLWRPSSEVGIYGAASVLVLAAPVVAGALGAALYPVLSRTGGTRDAQAGRLVAAAGWLLVVSGAVSGAVLFAAAPAIVGVLFGPSFGRAAPILSALTLVLPFRFVNTFAATGLVALGRASIRMRWAGVVAVLNVAGNLVLIPTMGLWGAVWTTLAGEIVLAAGLVAALRPIRFVSGRTVCGAVAGCTVVAAAALAGPSWLPLAAGTATLGLVAVVGYRRLASAGPGAVATQTAVVGQEHRQTSSRGGTFGPFAAPNGPTRTTRRDDGGRAAAS